MIRLGRFQLSLEGVALFVLVGGLLLGGVQCSARRDGVWAERARRAEAESDSLKRLVRVVDTIYRRDTVVLWRVKATTDTMTQTVDRWKHDTVEVVRYVRLADSTIRACTIALGTCEERVRLRDARIAALGRQLEASQPRPWKDRLEKLGWGLAGFGLGRLTAP